MKENRFGDEFSSWIGSIVIRFRLFTIVLEKGKTLVVEFLNVINKKPKSKFQVNREIVSLPYFYKPLGLRVTLYGDFIKLVTDEGLVVQFDGIYSFVISLPISLMNNVEGFYHLTTQLFQTSLFFRFMRKL